MRWGALASWQWFAAAALSGHVPAGAHKTLVRFGYFAESMPLGVACARHWLDTEDYEVGCFPQSSGSYAVSRLDQGDLDASLLGSTPAAICNSRGVRATTFQMAQGHGSSQGLAVRGNFGPLELTGKCLASPFGSTAHYHLLFFLHMLELPTCTSSMTCDEVSPSCVTVVDMSPSALVAAWDNEGVDGAFIWGEGFLHLKANGGTVVVDSADLKNWGRETFIVVAARQNFSEDFPGLLEHIARVKSVLDDGWLLPDSAWEARGNGNESFLVSMSHFLSKARPREMEAWKAADIYNDMRSKEIFSTETQLGCQYLSHSSRCPAADTHPVSGLAEAIKSTAMFFREQKGLATIVPSGMHYGEDPASFFHEMIDASALFAATGLHAVTLATLASNTGTGASPSTSSVEMGSCDSGGAVLSPTGNAVVGSFTDKLGISADTLGASYENGMHCIFRIPPASGNTSLVELTFAAFRVWSGDVVRVYEGDDVNGVQTGKLLAQLQGIDPVIPPIRSPGPIIIEFVTDANTEECYNLPQGDGWLVHFDRSHPGCINDESCIHGHCIQDPFLGQPRGVCACWPGWAGADCSFSGCLGTMEARTPTGTFTSGAGALQSTHRYANSAACIFEVYTEEQTVRFAIEMDLEKTFDWLEVRAGTGASAIVHARLTGNQTFTVTVPTIDGVASLHYITDDKGRRSGFVADYTTSSLPCQSQCSSFHGTCEGSTCVCAPGWTGVDCTLPFCSSGPSRYIGQASGVIQSNPDGTSIPAMTDCRFETEKLSVDAERLRGTHVGTRLLVQTFDLEPAPAGDRVTVSYAGTILSLRVERCTSSTDCSQSWQSGECVDQVCKVRSSIDVLTSSRLQVHIQTDRNDITAPNRRGVSMMWHAIATCPTNGRTDWECIGPPGSCDCEVSDGICSADGACECLTGHCACGCGGHLAQQPPLNVSVGLLLSSTSDEIREMYRQAAELAITHINADGFLPRINLQPVFVDTTSLRAAIVAGDAALLHEQVLEFERLLEVQEVTVAVGPSYSSTSFALAPLMGKALFISHSATHPGLSNMTTFPTFGRVVTPDDRQGIALADLLHYGQRAFDWGKVGIISCGDVYCRGLLEQTRYGLAELGITNVHEFGAISIVRETLEDEVRRILSEIPSWLESCSGIMEDATAVILLLTHGEEGEMLLELASENQLPVSFLASESVGSKTLGAPAARSALLALRPGGIDPTHSLHRLVAERLPAAAAHPFALRVFDATYAIAHAIRVVLQRGGNVSMVAELALAVQTVIFEGASGDIKFDRNLDRQGVYDIVTKTHNSTVTLGSWNSDDGSIALSLRDADRDRLVAAPVCGSGTAVEYHVVAITVGSVLVLFSIVLFAKKRKSTMEKKKKSLLQLFEKERKSTMEKKQKSLLLHKHEPFLYRPVRVLADSESVLVLELRKVEWEESAWEYTEAPLDDEDCRLALKIYKEQSEESASRFERECHMLRLLNEKTKCKPVVPLVYSVGKADADRANLGGMLNEHTERLALGLDAEKAQGYCALATELGTRSLLQELASKNNIPGKDRVKVRDYLRQIAKCVQAMHDEEIVHGALALRNVLVLEGERAKDGGSADGSGTKLTLMNLHYAYGRDMSGALVATSRTDHDAWQNNTSPEQARLCLDDKETEAESGSCLKAQLDVWGFGILALRMCTPGLATPYRTNVRDQITESEDKKDLAYRWSERKFECVRRVAWADAADLVLWCLHRTPKWRPKSFEEILKHPFFQPDNPPEKAAYHVLGEVTETGPAKHNGNKAIDAALPHLEQKLHLLSKGAQLKMLDSSISGSTVTPMMRATFVGHKSTVEVLLDEIEAHLEQKLHDAIRRSDTARVKHLLSKGAQLKMLDSSISGSTVTPMMRATFVGHKSTVEVLLNEIEDSWPDEVRKDYLDQRTSLDFTAYMIACACGRKEIARLLEAKGCSTHLLSKFGNTGDELLQEAPVGHEHTSQTNETLEAYLTRLDRKAIVMSCPEKGTLKPDGSGPYDQQVMDQINKLRQRGRLKGGFDRAGSSNMDPRDDKIWPKIFKTKGQEHLFEIDEKKRKELIKSTYWFTGYRAAAKAQMNYECQTFDGTLDIICITGGPITDVEHEEMGRIIEEATHDAAKNGIETSIELKKMSYLEFLRIFDPDFRRNPPPLPPPSPRVTARQDKRALRKQQEKETQGVGQQEEQRVLLPSWRHSSDDVEEGTAPRRRSKTPKAEQALRQEQRLVGSHSNDGNAMDGRRHGRKTDTPPIRRSRSRSPSAEGARAKSEAIADAKSSKDSQG